jgi:plastocyanin
MADPPRSPDTGAGADRGEGMPRWVKAFGIIVIVLVLLAVVVLLTGGGHGPGRHRGAGGATAPSSGPQRSGAVGGPADADQAARTVKVTTLDTMTFQPSRITVSAGETVTFVVTNTGQADHDFTLGDAAMQQQHAEAMAHMPGRDGP